MLLSKLEKPCKGVWYYVFLSLSKRILCFITNKVNFFYKEP